MVGHEGTVGAEAVARPKVMSCHVVSRHVLRAELALPQHIEPEIRFCMGSPQLKTRKQLRLQIENNSKTARKQLEITTVMFPIMLSLIYLLTEHHSVGNDLGA